jgi:hypothetical protein
VKKTLDTGRSLPLPLPESGGAVPHALPPHHLVTHTVVTGMTGSGKTGLLFVLAEEALRAGVPVLMVDVKGDMANLLLAFDRDDPAAFEPWVDPASPENEGRSLDEVTRGLAAERDRGLDRAGLTAAAVQQYRSRIAVRVLTPGTTAAEPVHLLSSLERRSPLWDTDAESARDALGAAISLVLRLVGRDADPARSKEHVLLSVFAERRLRDALSADLASLIEDLDAPPIERVGAMTVEQFLPKKDRAKLASALNALLAAPTFASWREGASLDVGAWLRKREDGRVPAVIVSVAHLDEDERAIVLGMLFDELLAYVRSLPGTSALSTLVVFDEVYGFIPPHPANPPTRRPLVALMKQARAFGVGMVLATQNPMDLDYRALSNAGLWFVGRLQTDADRERVIDGLTTSNSNASADRELLEDTVKQLKRRWFVVRNVHAGEGLRLFQPRQTITWLRGPLTRAELRRAQG